MTVTWLSDMLNSVKTKTANRSVKWTNEGGSYVTRFIKNNHTAIMQLTQTEHPSRYIICTIHIHLEENNEDDKVERKNYSVSLKDLPKGSDTYSVIEKIYECAVMIEATESISGVAKESNIDIYSIFGYHGKMY